MAKRFEPMKEFGRSTKKPRLEIAVNKGRPGCSSSAQALNSNRFNEKATAVTG